MVSTPWEMTVLNVLSTQCVISDEEFFVVYLKLLNAAFEAINVTCFLMDLNIRWDMAKKH